MSMIIEGPSTVELRVSLLCDESSPADAREAIRGLGPAAPLVGDAMLLASELVTNAVRHSGCGAADRITLRAEVHGTSLRVEVSDPARSGSVPRAVPEGAGFGPVGLRVVEALADRWGVERSDEQTVWAELSRP